MKIDSALITKLRECVSGKLFENELLSKYTTWKTGGAAELVFVPADADDLCAFLECLPDEIPVTLLGLGSNTLVLDGGVPGVVIIFQKSGFNRVEMRDNSLVYAQAGIACGQLARQCARSSLTGLEFFAGIPGTVGGALMMNAGCYGGETWSFVDSVCVVTRGGTIVEKKPEEFEVSYRTVKGLEDGIFISAVFKLTEGDKRQSLEKIKLLVAKRNDAQPTNYPNCGSVFKNPEGDYAARLIESAGLKGMTIGGAQISEKHANFIVNRGAASSEDIVQLIGLIKNKVKEVHGVGLVTEVRAVGVAR